MMGTLERVGRLWIILWLPFVAGHELAHAMTARALGHSARVSMIPPQTQVDYHGGRQTDAIVISLAPTAIGLILIIPLTLSAGAWLVSLAWMTSPVEVALFGYLFVGTVAFITPSRGDLENVLEAAKSVAATSR